MGSGFSRLQHIERVLHSVRPDDVNAAVVVSVTLQLLCFYGVMGSSIAQGFNNPAMPEASSSTHGGGKYAKMAWERAFRYPNENLLTSVLIQLGAAHLVIQQLIHKRPVLPTALLGAASSLSFAYIAWFSPVKMLASARLVGDGHVMTYLHLKEIVETHSERQQQVLARYKVGGYASMIGAVLAAYTGRKMPNMAKFFILYACLPIYKWVRTN